MGADDSDTLAPRNCRVQDLAAMIGLLALLEGEITAGHVPERLSRRIGSRLERAGLLAGGYSERDLRQSLSDLNHRLRYALGEYEEPPPSLAVPE